MSIENGIIFPKIPKNWKIAPFRLSSGKQGRVSKPPLRNIEMSKPNPDLTLDAISDICPIPIVKTAVAIKKIEIGQVLEILADDAGIVNDLIDQKASSKYLSN